MSAVNDTPTPLEMTSAAAEAVRTGSESDGTTMAQVENLGVKPMLAPNVQPEIKHEPPVDITDTIGSFSGAEESYDTGNGRGSDSPKIRLTPTIKLMATPKPLDPKRKFACPYEHCTKSYGKSSHLRSHLTWHTGIKPFVCKEPNCGKGFTRSDELNRHVRTHTGEKPFECIQCTKKFSRSDHLTKHLATHLKQMQNNAKRIRENHIEGKSKNASEQMNFRDGMHFMATLIEGCAEARAARSSKTEPSKSANLTEQQRANQTPIKIKLERPDHSGEYHVVPPPLPPLPPLTPAHQHIATSESEEEIIMPMPMICPPAIDIKCEPTDDTVMLEANAPPSLDNCAAKGHTPKSGECAANSKLQPERPFHCTQCAKGFKRLDDLNRHLRTHTGEKPFACVECKRRFMRRDHLMKHLKTHIKLR